MQCDDGERKTFRIKRRIILFILCLVCCFSIAGCGDEENGAFAAPELSAGETDAYEQMSLYIQEGFRIYGIEDAYQAYFGAVEREEEKFSAIYCWRGRTNCGESASLTRWTRKMPGIHFRDRTNGSFPGIPSGCWMRTIPLSRI